MNFNYPKQDEIRHFLFILNISNSQYQMDGGIIASELQAHRMREGPIYKRSKFLLHWQQRWGVLTMNFLFIFSDKSLKQLADYIDLRDLLSYKSYLRKDDDMIPSGFKLTTADQMHYFCARNCNQKWSWIVSIERLMDFKYTGKSPYNNLEWIKTRGFMSQGEFQRGKFDQRVSDIKPQAQKPKVQTKPKEVPKVNEVDLQKLKKQLQEQKLRIAAKEKELERQSKQQEELFILQLNKLKKAEQSLKQVQAQVQFKALQAEKIIQASRQNKPKQIIVEKIVEVIVERIVQKPVEVFVQKVVPIQKPKMQVNIQKKQAKQPQVQQSKQEELQALPPTIAKKQSTVGQKVSQMRKLYQNKLDTTKYPQTISKPVVNQKAKEQIKTKQNFLHLCRDKIIVNLFEEFHSKAYTYVGLRAIIEFIIKMCSERSLGYQSYFIREAKCHQNRYIFAEVFLELITNNKDYTIGKSFSKIVELLIFEAPGIFKLNHFDIIKRKMADLLFNATDENDLAYILKTMYVVHKVKKYEKNEKIQQKLKAVLEIKSQEAKNWAKKLLQDL